MTPPKRNNGEGAGQIQSVDGGKFLITGDLDYFSVPAVLKASQPLFSNSQSLVIDLSGVVRSDSAGLALLIEWMRIASSTKRDIKFLNLPDQMRQIAQLCGVSDALES